MKQEEGQEQGNDDAQLVDGHDLGHVAQLQGLVVAKPRRPRRQARQDEKESALPADAANVVPVSRQTDHAEGHD